MPLGGSPFTDRDGAFVHPSPRLSRPLKPCTPWGEHKFYPQVTLRRSSPLLLVAVGRFFACHVPQLVGKMSSSRISSSSKEDVRQVEMREDTFVYVEGSDEEKALLRKM